MNFITSILTLLCIIIFLYLSDVQSQAFSKLQSVTAIVKIADGCHERHAEYEDCDHKQVGSQVRSAALVVLLAASHLDRQIEPYTGNGWRLQSTWNLIWLRSRVLLY